MHFIMPKLSRVLLLTLLIVGALTCYFAGSTTGTVAFFVLGGVLEIAFWFGLFKGFKKRGSRALDRS